MRQIALLAIVSMITSCSATPAPQLLSASRTADEAVSEQATSEVPPGEESSQEAASEEAVAEQEALVPEQPGDQATQVRREDQVVQGDASTTPACAVLTDALGTDQSDYAAELALAEVPFEETVKTIERFFKKLERQTAQIESEPHNLPLLPNVKVETRKLLINPRFSIEASPDRTKQCRLFADKQYSSNYRDTQTSRMSWRELLTWLLMSSQALMDTTNPPKRKVDPLADFLAQSIPLLSTVTDQSAARLKAKLIEVLADPIELSYLMRWLLEHEADESSLWGEVAERNSELSEQVIVVAKLLWTASQSNFENDDEEEVEEEEVEPLRLGQHELDLKEVLSKLYETAGDDGQDLMYAIRFWSYHLVRVAGHAPKSWERKLKEGAKKVKSERMKGYYGANLPELM
ncbi:hypothetical protein ACFLZY_00395 [Patescibacteria group bacterium]